MKALDYDYVNSCLNYDPATGSLTWKERPREHFATERAWKTWNLRFAGREAGAKYAERRTHYRKIKINNRDYLAHRLAFLLFWGCWPTDQIDHLDGNGLNNRWDNLREATSQENNRNKRRRRNNTSGVNGVYWHRGRRKWCSRIKLDGRYVHLGYFDTLEEAAAARLASNETHGFTGRHGEAA